MSNHIEYERNGGRSKTLSVERYVNKITPYLKDIINSLKEYGRWKNQLAITNKQIMMKRV